MSTPTVLCVKFQCQPVDREGRTIRDLLAGLFDTLAREPGFAGAVLHEHLDRPNELFVYETWELTREQYLSDVRTRPYWESYERTLVELCIEREANWLHPIAQWPR